MSSVDIIDPGELQTHNGDGKVVSKINAGKLYTNLGVLRTRLNDIIAALDALSRDDDTLDDESIRIRMLHPELIN